MVVNAGQPSTMWGRAAQLYRDLDAVFVSGRDGDVGAALRRLAPHAVALIDVGRSTPAVLGYLHDRRRPPLVLEIGDWNGPLLAAQGRPLEAAAGSVLERLAVGHAAVTIVRGRYMLPYIHRARTHWIPDGVDARAFAYDPEGRAQVRRSLQIPADAFVVGMVGNLAWSPRHQRAYGEEVIHIVGHLPDVHGLVVGDGTGLHWMRALAERYGVAERVRFAGRVPHVEVPAHLSAVDAVTSYQSNDAIGWSRTTAKLPEYLASGRILVVSSVGEGVELPATICAHVEQRPGMAWWTGFVGQVAGVRDRWRPMAHEAMEVGPRLAQERYDYAVLRRRLAEALTASGLVA